MATDRNVSVNEIYDDHAYISTPTCPSRDATYTRVHVIFHFHICTEVVGFGFAMVISPMAKVHKPLRDFKWNMGGGLQLPNGRQTLACTASKATARELYWSAQVIDVFSDRGARKRRPASYRPMHVRACKRLAGYCRGFLPRGVQILGAPREYTTCRLHLHSNSSEQGTLDHRHRGPK